MSSVSLNIRELVELSTESELVTLMRNDSSFIIYMRMPEIAEQLNIANNTQSESLVKIVVPTGSNDYNPTVASTLRELFPECFVLATASKKW